MPASTSLRDQPWRLDVRDLMHATGSLRTVQEQWPAPTGLSVPLLGIPEGAPVEVELRLESVHEGILVTGTADAELVGECSRCLDPIRTGATVDLQELFLNADPGDEEDALVVERDTVDLEPVLRDAVVTSLPFQPVCRPDCQGLCPDCGIRLEDAPADHSHHQVDPRWAALSALAGTEQAEPSADSTQTSTDETEKR